MAKQKLKMTDVVDAFFKYKTATSGRHKTDGGHYYYRGNLIATITKTKFIINPDKNIWNSSSFHGNYAQSLLMRYCTNIKQDANYWTGGKGWPFITNKGWGYVYNNMLFAFPLVINRKINKITNKIDPAFVIAKFKYARNIYIISRILGCINHFNIKVPAAVLDRKKDILCGRLTVPTYYPSTTIDTLFKLKANKNDLVNIKNAIKNRIINCKDFYNIENTKTTIDKYFKDDTEMKAILIPKYVELKFDQELRINK